MTQLDWFALLWVGGAIAYLTLLVKETAAVDGQPEEAGGAGDAGTLGEPAVEGPAAGSFTTQKE